MSCSRVIISRLAMQTINTILIGYFTLIAMCQTKFEQIYMPKYRKLEDIKKNIKSIKLSRLKLY